MVRSLVRDEAAVVDSRGGNSVMAQHVVVETNCGKIRGVAEHAGNRFKGVHYAESPEGEGEFAAPRRLQPWTGVRDAFDFGNRAMQDENAFAMPPAMLK